MDVRVGVLEEVLVGVEHRRRRVGARAVVQVDERLRLGLAEDLEALAGDGELLPDPGGCRAWRSPGASIPVSRFEAIPPRRHRELSARPGSRWPGNPAARRLGPRRPGAWPWAGGRSRCRPGSGCGLDTAGRSPRANGRRRGQTGAGDGTRESRARCIDDPARPRSGIARRRARARCAGPRPGCGARRATCRCRPRLFLGAFVFAKRRASSRSSFSVTACSMIAPRSPSGTEERISAVSRSSLSRRSALAVNWTR